MLYKQRGSHKDVTAPLTWLQRSWVRVLLHLPGTRSRCGLCHPQMLMQKSRRVGQTEDSRLVRGDPCKSAPVASIDTRVAQTESSTAVTHIQNLPRGTLQHNVL